MATGSPFPAVELDGVTCRIAQADNALVFPGLGLGVKVSRARRISDEMLQAAADAVVGLHHVTRPGTSLLPTVADLRPVSAIVAVAVVQAAVEERLALTDVHDPLTQVHAAMRELTYPSSQLCSRTSSTLLSPGPGHRAVPPAHASSVPGSAKGSSCASATGALTSCPSSVLSPARSAGSAFAEPVTPCFATVTR